MNECKHPDCHRPVLSRGYCRGHYRRLLAGKPLDPPLRDPLTYNTTAGRRCEFPDCGRTHHGRGLCRTHLDALLAGRPLKPIRPRRPRAGCRFPDCDRPSYSAGWCRGHARQHKNGRGMWPIGKQPRPERTPKPKPKPKPRKRTKPARTAPSASSAPKPNANLPAGWFKPTIKKRKPARAVISEADQFHIPPTPPLPRAVRRAARATLERHGADTPELLAMLDLEDIAS